MPLSVHGKVFVYDENQAILNNFDNFFADRSLKMFGSDNLYQIIRYAREISPDMMIFNIQDIPERTFSPVGHFENNIKTQYPIIVIRSDNVPFKIHPSVAHYLRMPRDTKKMTDITESYTVGAKNHPIMLLSSYSEKNSNLKCQFEDDGIPYFEVHNKMAAEIYLRKNTPQIICIENTETYKMAQTHIQHSHIFYVDRTQDITEIKKFLH